MNRPIFALTLLLGSAWTFIASADFPPPDACQTEGEACANAGPAGDQPGVCTKATCERSGPNGSTSYDCLLCEPQSVDGSGGNSASPGPATSGGGSDAGAGVDGAGGATLGGVEDGAGGGSAEPIAAEGAGGASVEAAAEQGGGGTSAEAADEDAAEGSGGTSPEERGTPVAMAAADTTTDAPADAAGCAVRAPQKRGLMGLGAPLAMIAAGVLALRWTSRRPQR